MSDANNNGNELNNKVIDLPTAKGNSDSKFINFQPNDELLQSTARIKKQRDVILQRLEKMNDSSSRVSQEVYDKVSRDYSLQLQTINELLNEKKETLKKEIKELYLRREKLTVEINRHKDILEEADFRHFLGEFSQSQFQEVENYETKEIEKLENDLSQISKIIREHEELFDPQDLSPKQEVTKTMQTQQTQQTVAQQTTATPQTTNRAATPTQEPQREVIESKKNDNIDDIEISDFEDLFLDDDDEESVSIKSEKKSVKNVTADNIKVDTSGDQDYFNKDKVGESSYNNQDSEEITPAKTESLKTETDVSVAPTASTNDSISEILDSIHIGEDQNQTSPDKEANIPLDAAEPIDENAEYMLQLIEGELDSKIFPLKENTSIGRSPSSDVPLKAPKVSRQHAAINVYNNQYIIIDLKSSNGVYVNGAKIDECILNAGDEVSIGGYKFIFTKNPGS